MALSEAQLDAIYVNRIPGLNAGDIKADHNPSNVNCAAHGNPFKIVRCTHGVNNPSCGTCGNIIPTRTMLGCKTCAVFHCWNCYRAMAQ